VPKNANVLTAAEAAELADVNPAQLKSWLDTGKFESFLSIKEETTGQLKHFFCDEDIDRLLEFIKQSPTSRSRPMAAQEPFVDDGKQENFTVAEIASLWKLSTDTIQRLFEDEPGVVVLGDKNPRGKRKRITLRIPRQVMERVKKTRSNPK